MKYEPSIDRSQLIATLRDLYGLQVHALQFVPVSFAAVCYVVRCEDGTWHFVAMGVQRIGARRHRRYGATVGYICPKEQVSMNLVFIYGPPAAGKLSVATELAALTGYVVFHNHVSIDFVKPIFAWGTPSFSRTVEALRLLIIEEAARAAQPGMIFTFVYAYPEDTPFALRVVDAVERHGGSVHFVQLVCDPATLEARIGAESRTGYGKITSVDTLREVVDRYDLFTPMPDRESFTIDTTTITPPAAAQRIRTHYHL